MVEDAISKAKLEGWNKASQSFYTDFMPMIQAIQYNISILNFFDDEGSQKHLIGEINKQTNRALMLLKQIKRFSDKLSAAEVK